MQRDYVIQFLNDSATILLSIGRAFDPLISPPVSHTFSHPRLNTVGPTDVKIKIMYCGICHSDLHTVRCEWGQCAFPLVPGHEIVGVIEEVGQAVTKFKVGSRGAVGCIVDSCRTCQQCKEHRTEQYCDNQVFTYNAKLKDGSVTQGGYSSHIVVDQDFVLNFPDTLPMDAGAPLLCAGITVYSPMKYYGLDKAGLKFGVVGLGGLGHMAVKFAKAFGMEVTVISSSPSKKEEAISRLGADNFVVSKSEEDMKAAAGSLDGIIDTVSAKHDLSPYLTLLKPSGKYVCVGAPPEPYQVSAVQLLLKRLLIGGSLIGGIAETQEMLDFCAAHNVVCDIEKIPMSYVNSAYDRLLKADVRYRFVLDLNTLGDAE